MLLRFLRQQNSFLTICHNAVGNVLHVFVLKCTEREKPCVQESPSSVVITNKHLVCELRLRFTDAEVELSCHPLASHFPSLSCGLCHGYILFFLQRFLSSPLPLPCARRLLGRPWEGAEGRIVEPELENLHWKKGCCTTSFAGKSQNCFSPSSWKSLLVLTSDASQRF